MNYQEYLQSEAWQLTRLRALHLWEGRCAVCFSPEQVHVHHRTYQRLGHERITDVIVLCDRCHMKHHGIPAKPVPIIYELNKIAAKIAAGGE